MGISSEGESLVSKEAVFIDRDGTLIELEMEPTMNAHIRLFPYSAQAVRRLNELGYRVIVHTNQPIIEKGIITREQADELNDYMKSELTKEGARVDGVYLCPHRYNGVGCRCRKPDVGLIEDAQKDFPIDMAKSWLVGDTTRDMETGVRAGLRTVLVMTGDGGKDTQFFKTKGEFEAENILEAVEVVERESK